MQEYIEYIKESLEKDDFVKLTLSKPYTKSASLKNVYLRLIEIKGVKQFSFLYRYITNDQTKNYTFEEAFEVLETLLLENFRIATLFRTEENILFLMNKKRKGSIRKEYAENKRDNALDHDKNKEKRAENNKDYLFHLGVTDKTGQVIPKMADKFRQINKYLEVMESLVKNTKLPSPLHVVDMGSGKGYLTFALYDFLKNNMGLDVRVTGVELREELVTYCSDVAKKSQFEDLKFEASYIQDINPNQIDVLIALHACDTATDDAIYKGMMSDASIVVCAPCCHKQIRQQLKGKSFENPILRYGIFKERQFEMVTDTIRSLILEQNKYQTKVFEFVSNEHTRKNVLLVGTKGKTALADAQQKIDKLKNEYSIDSHYLEELLNEVK